MSLALQQGYQIFERDIQQPLAAYHGARGVELYAKWRECTRLLPTSGSSTVIYRTMQSDIAVQVTSS